MKEYEHNRDLEIKHKSDKYIGKIFQSKNCGEFKIIGIYGVDSNRHLQYICKFLNTGFETLTISTCIKNGSIIDKYARILCGVGYAGDYKGNYSNHFLFIHWSSMIERCYNPKYTCYREFGEVNKNWYCFSTFIEDCKNLSGYKEMKEHPNIRFDLDKDFINESNQIYSKYTCCFLPHFFNTFILTQIKNRDYKFEGVYLRSDNLKFRSSIRFEEKTKSIIQSDNPKIAHDAYWVEKYNIAELYLENEFSYLSEELKQIIFNRIELRKTESEKELHRAIEDGYFDLIRFGKRRDENVI